MPHSIKLQEEYGDDLAVLFVEVQGTPREKAEAFALKKKWLGGRALWTTERPFSLGIRGIPHFALLSPEGEIVLSGHNSALQGPMEDLIEDMVKSLKKGPEELPKKVAKAWARMGRGEYSKALADARELVSHGDEDEVAGAERLIETLKRRVAARVERTRWLVENGFPLTAQDELRELQKNADEGFEVATTLAELEATLESDEYEPEIDAAKDLAKIEKKLFEDPDEKHLKKLAKFLEDHGETRVAARAKQLRDLVALATG